MRFEDKDSFPGGAKKGESRTNYRSFVASLTIRAADWLKSSGGAAFFGTCAGRRSTLLSSSSACRCALSAFVRFVAIPTASHNGGNSARTCRFQIARLPNRRPPCAGWLQIREKPELASTRRDRCGPNEQGTYRPPRWDARQFELFSVFAPFALGSWVNGANMQPKLSVALQLEVPHHFIERFAGGRTGRFEPPATFGATKTPKTLLLNPYQLPTHGGQILQAPIWMVCRASYIHGRIFVRAHARFGSSFEVAESLKC